MTENDSVCSAAQAKQLRKELGGNKVIHSSSIPKHGHNYFVKNNSPTFLNLLIEHIEFKKQVSSPTTTPVPETPAPTDDTFVDEPIPEMTTPTPTNDTVVVEPIPETTTPTPTSDTVVVEPIPETTTPKPTPTPTNDTAVFEPVSDTQKVEVIAETSANTDTGKTAPEEL